MKKPVAAPQGFGSRRSSRRVQLLTASGCIISSRICHTGGVITVPKLTKPRTLPSCHCCCSPSRCSYSNGLPPNQESRRLPASLLGGDTYRRQNVTRSKPQWGSWRPVPTYADVLTPNGPCCLPGRLGSYTVASITDSKQVRAIHRSPLPLRDSVVCQK